MPFNIIHAQKTGLFARVIFGEKGNSNDNLHPRAIIPNDSKLFAQAHLDKNIKYFVTSDGYPRKVGHFLALVCVLTNKYCNKYCLFVRTQTKARGYKNALIMEY